MKSVSFMFRDVSFFHHQFKKMHFCLSGFLHKLSKHRKIFSITSHGFNKLFHSSSSSSYPRAFPIILVAGMVLNIILPLCPVLYVGPTLPLTPYFPNLFYTSLTTYFSIFLSVSFLVGLLVHLTFFLESALRPFS